MTQLIRPNLDEIDALTGARPQQYSRQQAALAFDAASLIASNLPWWPIMCGYRWTAEVTGGCPRLEGNARRLCEDHDLPMPLWPADMPYKLEWRWLRAPIPASIYACLAVVQSGGDLSYYRATPVKVGGLFAIPLDTARSIGMNPWAVYDALRYARVVVEGVVDGWMSRFVPAPNCARVEDYVAASLFQYLAGGTAATFVFAALEDQGVYAESILRYVLGTDVDWSSRAYSGVGKERVQSAAVQVLDILRASELVEGWWWASRIGLDARSPSAAPSLGPKPPREGYHFAFPALALSDPAAAASSSVVTYPTTAGPRPASMRSYLDLVQLLYPMEYGDEASLVARGIDEYQAHHILIAGHYRVRHAVLSATVPGYLTVTAPTPPEPPPARRRPTQPTASTVPWAAWAALAAGAAAAVVGGVYWWWIRRRGARRPMRWQR